MSQFGVIEPDASNSMPSTRRLPASTVTPGSRIGHARVGLLVAEDRGAQLQAGQHVPLRADFVVLVLLRVEVLVDRGQVGLRGPAVDAELAGRVVRVAVGHVVRLRRRRLPDEAGAAAQHVVGARRTARRGAADVADSATVCALGLEVLVAQPDQRLPLRRELDLVLHVDRGGVASASALRFGVLV